MLSPQQQAVIDSDKDQKLVVATAGSGKTTLLVALLKNLIEEKGVAPSSILVTTFNTNAKEQLVEKVFKALGKSSSQPNIFTLHALGFRYLSKYLKDVKLDNQTANFMIYKNFKIYDPEKFLEITSKIGVYVNTGNSVFSSEEMKAYLDFKDEKRRAGIIDFNDMIELFNEHLDEVPVEFEYVIIDEFQDMSAIQWRILKKLASKSNRIVAVGDDDQNIYEWRGSSSSIMLNMHEEFPELERFHLSTNYRCPSNVLIPLTTVIGNNNKRFDKDILAHNKGGELKVINNFPYKFLQEGLTAKPEEEHLILSRTAKPMALLLDYLTVIGTEFKYTESAKNIYLDQLKEVKAMIDLYSACKSPKNYEKGAKVFSLFKTKVPVKLAQSQLKMHKDLFKSKYIPSAVTLEGLIKSNNAIGFIRYCGHYLWTNKENSHHYLNMICQELEILELDRLIAYITSSKTRVDRLNKKESNIELMTCHACKGLEYDNVYITGVYNGNFPTKPRSEEIEAERRLFYVAATRTKKNLYIFTNGEESMFAKEVLR